MDEPRCSFCDKTQREVLGMVERAHHPSSGVHPRKVRICNECVVSAVEQLLLLDPPKSRKDS